MYELQGMFKLKDDKMEALILLNQVPIIWYSERQPGIENVHSFKLFKALRCKLRIFGIPFEGLTSVFCDNNVVVLYSSIPDLTLAKKHNSVPYHRVHKAVALGTMQIAKEDTLTNMADPFTKMLTAKCCEELFDLWLYYDWCLAGGTTVPSDLLFSTITGTLEMQVNVMRYGLSRCREPYLLPPLWPASREVKDAGQFGLIFDDCMCL
jgi:hypothetical protein